MIEILARWSQERQLAKESVKIAKEEMRKLIAARLKLRDLEAHPLNYAMIQDMVSAAQMGVKGTAILSDNTRLTFEPVDMLARVRDSVGENF